jgi:uncharacterized protein YutE (UPF0331/DUF86 family)
MTPRRFSPAAVQAKIEMIDRLLTQLDSMGSVSAARLESEPIERAAVERFLTQIVELAASANAHIAAAQLGRVPGGYADAFRAAAEGGAISAELAEELAPSAGLRNALVQQYLDFDLAVVADAVPRALSGYRRYVQQVARYLQESVWS